jgi:hypothetical protein
MDFMRRRMLGDAPYGPPSLRGVDELLGADRDSTDEPFMGGQQEAAVPEVDKLAVAKRLAEQAVRQRLPHLRGQQRLLAVARAMQEILSGEEIVDLPEQDAARQLEKRNIAAQQGRVTGNQFTGLDAEQAKAVVARQDMRRFLTPSQKRMLDTPMPQQPQEDPRELAPHVRERLAGAQALQQELMANYQPSRTDPRVKARWEQMAAQKAERDSMIQRNRLAHFARTRVAPRYGMQAAQQWYAQMSQQNQMPVAQQPQQNPQQIPPWLVGGVGVGG